MYQYCNSEDTEVHSRGLVVCSIAAVGPAPKAVIGQTTNFVGTVVDGHKKLKEENELLRKQMQMQHQQMQQQMNQIQSQLGKSSSGNVEADKAFRNCCKGSEMTEAEFVKGWEDLTILNDHFDGQEQPEEDLAAAFH